MEEENQNLELNNLDSTDDSLIRVSGMYKDWFLDYASYVILERAVPSIDPVTVLHPEKIRKKNII